MATISGGNCDGMYVFYTATSGAVLPVVSGGMLISDVVDNARAANVGVARINTLITNNGSGAIVANTADTPDRIPAGSYIRAMSLVKLGCTSASDVGYDYTVLSGGEIKAVPANGTVTLIDVVS